MSLYVKHSMGGDYPPRIVCFVCGTEGPADYPLYTRYPKSFANSDDYIHLPLIPALTGWPSRLRGLSPTSLSCWS